jgi:hypothetical protein
MCKFIINALKKEKRVLLSVFPFNPTFGTDRISPEETKLKRQETELAHSVSTRRVTLFLVDTSKPLTAGGLSRVIVEGVGRGRVCTTLFYPIFPLTTPLPTPLTTHWIEPLDRTTGWKRLYRRPLIVGEVSVSLNNLGRDFRTC